MAHGLQRTLHVEWTSEFDDTAICISSLSLYALRKQNGGRRNIPDDDILHNHRRESLKSYIASTGWAL
jgi:hypothetical protein